MAPRSHGSQQGTTRGVGSTSRLPSASTGVGRSTPGHRGVLNANTGAGVNARRSTATGNRARGGSTHVHRHQRTPQARQSTDAPRFQDDRVGRRQEHGRLSNDDNNNNDNARHTLPLPSRTPTTTTTNTRSPPTFPIRRINFTTLHLSTPPLTSGPRLTRIFPSSSSSFHRTLSPLSAPGHSPSFTLPPPPPAPPIRMLNIIPSTPLPTPSTSFLFPKPRHTKQPLYRGKDDVKRAVSNPNLRAILAGKAWPRERKKAAGERPVLRMGISKEYK